MTVRPLLALGPDDGWHAAQLKRAAERLGRQLVYAPYESLAARIDSQGRSSATCSAGELQSFDAVLCRTMPAGSLEQITFRLAVLHRAVAAGMQIVNPPRTLELAIDKYATLDIVASLGYPVPETVVVQSRKDAMEAFDLLGGDVVVKPIFGGEGRGVMRIRDRQLAWYSFSTLEGLDAVLYVQKFVPPGGRDIRMLVIGEEVFGIRRTNDSDFRTNVAGGGIGKAMELQPSLVAMALRIAAEMSLVIGSIDLIDCDLHGSVVVEVNGVPGWKGAQGCLQVDLAERMIRCLLQPPRQEPTALPDTPVNLEV
jgi:RimK family alpha-L-glutamate ligase